MRAFFARCYHIRTYTRVYTYKLPSLLFRFTMCCVSIRYNFFLIFFEKSCVNICTLNNLAVNLPSKDRTKRY